MTNYLSYIGVILTSYFLGFNFSMLCKSTYDLFTKGGHEYALQFLILFWMYFSGLKTTIYNILTIILYNLLMNLDKVSENLSQLREEYYKFMEFYKKETEIDSSKKSKFIEYYKNGLELSQMYMDKLNEKILLNKYLEKVLTYIEKIDCNKYVNDINNRIDCILRSLLDNLRKKFPSLDNSFKTFEEYNKLNTDNEKILQQTTSLNGDLNKNLFDNNLKKDISEVSNMIAMMDNLFKTMENEQLNGNDQMPPDSEDFKKFMNEFENIQKLTKELDVENLLKDDNLNRSQRRKMEKMNKKRN